MTMRGYIRTWFPRLYILLVLVLLLNAFSLFLFFYITHQTESLHLFNLAETEEFSPTSIMMRSYAERNPTVTLYNISKFRLQEPSDFREEEKLFLNVLTPIDIINDNNPAGVNRMWKSIATGDIINEEGNLPKPEKKLLKKVFDEERKIGTLWVKKDGYYVDYVTMTKRIDQPITYYKRKKSVETTNQQCLRIANLEVQEPIIWKQQEENLLNGDDVVDDDDNHQTQQMQKVNDQEIKILCYVITMPQRCESVIQRLQKTNLPCTIMGALDGTGIFPKPDLHATAMGMLSQYGCFESHRRALTIFRSTPENVATHLLVFEDDVLYPPNIAEHTFKRVRQLNKYKPGWDLYYLIYIHEVHPDNRRLVANDTDLYSAINPKGTAGYIVTRPGTEKLLNKTLDWTLPIDEIYAQEIQAKAIDAYIVWPSPLSYVNSESTIWEQSSKAVITTGRLFKPESHHCCCKDEKTESYCSTSEICLWHPVHPNCQKYREEEGINYCKSICPTNFKSHHTPIGHWTGHHPGHWKNDTDQENCKNQTLACVTNQDVSQYLLRKKYHHSPKELTALELLGLPLKGKIGDRHYGEGKMKLLLTFFANMVTLELDLIPGKGSLYISYGLTDHTYPDSHNIFPSNKSEVLKTGPKSWEMTVRVHALKFKGAFTIQEEKLKKKEQAELLVQFIGNQNDRAKFNLSSRFPLDHPQWGKFFLKLK